MQEIKHGAKRYIVMRGFHRVANSSLNNHQLEFEVKRFPIEFVTLRPTIEFLDPNYCFPFTPTSGFRGRSH